MCGLAGYFDAQGAPADETTVRVMNDLLAHRGPDAGEVRTLAEGSGPTVVFAHRRLAIIDLDPVANQPLFNEDGTVAVVFNGEIYNFESLRRELEMLGHRFRSRTDTEVIVHGYESFGDAVVERLDGMFAFALWDGRRRRMLLARDRAGKKPLFYCWDGRRFTFASEVKALRSCPWVDPEIDWSKLPELLRRGFVAAPRTLHTTIRQVPAASTLAVDVTGPGTPQRYWDFPLHVERKRVSWDEAVEGVRHHLREAVRRRLVSDVPLGALLSGGLDSSIVVALMAEVQSDVRTFTAGLADDASFDERHHARVVSEHFGTVHTEVEVRTDAAELLETVLWHLDQPIADSSAIPTYAISRATREHVTVALVGDGSDEVFGGYERYRAGIVAEHLPKAAIGALRGASALLPESTGYFSLGARARRFTASAQQPLPGRYQAWMAVFDTPLLDRLIVPGLAPADDDPVARLWSASTGVDPLTRMQHADFHAYLHDDLLVKMDRMSMAVSLETRSPLLDTALLEYVAGLPSAMKASPTGGKRILRRAAAGLLPPSIVSRRKHGFGVPVANWFRGNLVEPFGDLVLADDARTGPYLRREVVQQLLDDHRAERANHGPRLWSLLALEGWLRGLEVRAPAGRGTQS